MPTTLLKAVQLIHISRIHPGPYGSILVYRAMYAPFVYFFLQAIVNGVTDEIMATFRGRVSTRDWLDEPTIRRCQQKASVHFATIECL